jgi:splicing factor 3A subunit 1
MSENSNIPSDITIPPAEVRTLIGKTATYVNKNGVAFENKIRTKESNNPKFIFLNDKDPYHAYYQHLLNILKTGGKLPIISQEDGQDLPPDEIKKQNELTEKEPLEKPTDYKFLQFENNQLIYLEDKVIDTDLKIIKLVAQFAVVNGSNVFNNFKNYVLNNTRLSSQYQFLKGTHSLHKLYEKYLNIYKLIWTEKKQLIEEFGTKLPRHEFLDSCFNKAEYLEKEDINTNEIKERILSEKIKVESIDWLDFELVETIDFTALDDVAQLNKPLNKSDLEYRSLVQKGQSSIFDQLNEEAEEAEEEEFIEEENFTDNSQDEEEGIPQYQENKEDSDTDKEVDIQSNKLPKGMKVKAAGESRLLKRRYQQGNFTNNNEQLVDPITKEKLLRCPLTDKLIPESKFQVHISTLLRDPKYSEEKQRYESKFKYGSGLSTEQVYENIQNLVKNKENKRQKL